MPSETVTRYQQTRLEDSKKEKISLLSFCVTLCVYIKEDVELIIFWAYPNYIGYYWYPFPSSRPY